jgi:hypothetical protein
VAQSAPQVFESSYLFKILLDRSQRDFDNNVVEIAIASIWQIFTSNDFATQHIALTLPFFSCQNDGSLQLRL